MSLSGEKTRMRIKRSTLNLKGSNQGIGLGLSLHNRKKVAVPRRVGEKSRQTPVVSVTSSRKESAEPSVTVI